MVEFGKSLDVSPNGFAVGVKYVRPVSMHVDPGHSLREDVAARMPPAIDDQASVARVGQLPRSDRAK
jgi:hypothetical protein